MSRTRKSALNFAGGVVFTVVTVCVGVFSTPWLLSWLGVERFGTYRVLIDWTLYLALLELGLGGALSARLAIAVGKGEKQKVQSLLSAGLHKYFVVAITMLVVGLGLVFVLPYAIKTDLIGTNELQIAWVLLLVPVLLFPLAVFRYLADARQQSYLVSLLLTLQFLITTSLLIIAARAGWGLIGQSIATVIAQVPAVLILAWVGMRAYSIKLFSAPEPEARKAISELNWSMFLYNTSIRVGILSDTIVVAALLGPAAVAHFFLTQRLAILANHQLLNIGYSTWVGLVELHSQGQFETFKTRLLELTGLVSGLGLAILIPIAAFNYHFVSRWVGSETFAGETVNILVCVNIWLWAIFYLWGGVLSGTGQISHWTPYAVAFTVINLVISVVCTATLGLIGPLLGTTVGFLLVTTWALPRLLKKIFGLSPLVLWRNALMPLLWAIPYAAILGIISRARRPTSWTELILYMSIAGLIGIALWWRLGLSRNDRLIWKSRLQGAIGR